MGKKGRMLEGRSKQERAEQRKKLGSLKSLAVQPATKKRYDAALNKFFDFLKYESLELPKQKLKMDALLADYVEHLWSSGEGRALASDTVAGLQDLEPHLKGNLPTVWRLLKVWNQNEIPNRAPPMPETVVHALAGQALLKGDTEFALSNSSWFLCHDAHRRTFECGQPPCGSKSIKWPRHYFSGLDKRG